MAIYPTSDTDLRVPPARLIFVVRAVFVRCGMSEEDAALLAESLVRADLRGVHSHGVLRVPDYVSKLTKEGVDPRGRPRIVSERAGAIVIDGDNSMGQISGSFAMKRAIEKARKNGVAIAAVRGSNHCGAMDWYTMMAARESMIGLAGTNALPTMAPWAGRTRLSASILCRSQCRPQDILPSFLISRSEQPLTGKYESTTKKRTRSQRAGRLMLTVSRRPMRVGR